MDLFRGPIAERRVETFAIVAELDVSGYICAGVFACRIHGAVDSFHLQCRIERLRLRVIETRSGATDRAADVELGGGAGERFAGVLSAAIEWKIAPSASVWLRAAICSASITRSARMWSASA